MVLDDIEIRNILGYMEMHINQAQAYFAAAENPNLSSESQQSQRQAARDAFFEICVLCETVCDHQKWTHPKKVHDRKKLKAMRVI